MKHLANCKPSEFLTQTNKIRKSVSKWLTDTDIVNIRRRVPAFNDDISDEERKEALDKQANENFTAILDAILEDHPQETMEMLALLCFVEPEDIDNHEVTEYLEAFSEIIGDEAVMRFFMSLMTWVQKLT